MGTAVSLDIPKAEDRAIFETVFKRLRSIDERFSPYKATSELCRFQGGEIKKADLSREMRRIMAACAAAETETDGYFSAYFDGQFNPTGYVKGWAIAEAGRLLKANGFKAFCLGIGGDILAASDGHKTWRIGLQDPRDPRALIGQLDIKNGAVATSGIYERGKHIINPKTGQPATELLSLSVTGPDIVKADVLTTAGLAMGQAGLAFIARQKGYQALAIDRRGELSATSDMLKALNHSLENNR